MLNDLVSTSKQTRELLQDYILGVCIRKNSAYDEHQAYCLARDKAYQRSCSKDGSLTVPVVFSQIKSIQAMLNNIFVSRTPIFQAVANKELTHEATVLTALMERDATFFNWRNQLSSAFLDGLKYNLLAVEVDWTERKRFVYDATSNTRKLMETTYAGNRIKRLDPYNLFFDPRVPLPQQHINGDFAAYVELYTYSQFARFWQENKEFLYTDTKNSIGECAPKLYTVPPIRKDSNRGDDTLNVNWDTFLETRTNAKKLLNGVEIITCYFRAVPLDFNIVVPDRSRVQTFKAIFANETLIHLSVYNSNHNYIPIIFDQPMDPGTSYQAKSVAESIEDIQELASSLWNAEMQATKRVIVDRAIYNPALVSPEHVNNVNASRIPMRRVSYNADPSRAFYKIPYDDPALGLRLQQARETFGFAYTITGQNPVTQGQFVKGNKTNQQFQESMMASQSRIIDLAISLEGQFMQAIKMLLVENIFSYLGPGKVLDRESQETLTVDPERLRNIAYEFEIADGLFEAQKLIGFQEFLNFFTVLSSFPDVRMQYDIAGMLEYIGKTSGARHIADFKLTPEQQQQMMQNAMAMAAMQSIGEAAGPTMQQQIANQQAQSQQE